MSFLINPEPNDNKKGQNGERKQFQSHSSGIRKNRETFSPTFKPGKYSQASIHKVLHPSAEELNPPGGKAKGCPREYSHTSHGCTRGY
jgi:hypothetical protein